MKRDAIIVAVIWVALVVVGEILVYGFSYLPAQFSREAHVVDDAYILLSALAVPVFAFVIAMVVYSVIRFRARSDEVEDGPPIKTSRAVVTTWLIITSALAIGILINPGFVGLAEIRGEQSAEMVIDVESRRWSWVVGYENGASVTDELVVPVDTRIRFDVTSTDILHSFWVPAFRVKIDAVPGRTTQLFMTATKTGTLEDDPGLRVQCAELCGVGHGIMAIPVRVLPEAEFEAWLNGLQAQTSAERRGN